VSLVPLASTHQNEALESFYDAIEAANDLVPDSWMLKGSRRRWIVNSLYDLQQCLMEADTCDIRFAQLIISPDGKTDISQLLDQDMLQKLGFPELTISTSVMPPIQFPQRPGEMTIPKFSDTLFTMYQMSGDANLHELRVRVHDVKGVIPLLARRADLLARFRHVAITFDHSALVQLHSIGVSLDDPPAPPNPGAVRRLGTMTIKVHDTGLLLREREENRHDRLLANTAWIRHIAKLCACVVEAARPNDVSFEMPCIVSQAFSSIENGHVVEKVVSKHYETELHRLLAAILAERKALGGHTALGWRRTCERRSKGAHRAISVRGWAERPLRKDLCSVAVQCAVCLRARRKAMWRAILAAAHREGCCSPSSDSRVCGESIAAAYMAGHGRAVMATKSYRDEPIPQLRYGYIGVMPHHKIEQYRPDIMSSELQTGIRICIKTTIALHHLQGLGRQGKKRQ
jgi:hypothetical protein